MEPMKNIPVYRHSAAYAVEHGELEAYKTSRVAGVACRDAIEKAVAKHYRDNCLNKAGAREVIDEFGKERVMTVLAITIQDKLYDGRFSSANKKAYGRRRFRLSRTSTVGAATGGDAGCAADASGAAQPVLRSGEGLRIGKGFGAEKLKAAAENAPVPSKKNEMER